MKFDMPDTSNMTIDEKVDASLTAATQLHDCLEEHREETRIAFKALGAQLGELSVSQSINNGVTTALAKRLGVNGLDVNEDGEVHGIEKVKAAVGAWSLKKTLAVLSAASPILILLGIFGPPFVSFLHECWVRLLAYVYH